MHVPAPSQLQLMAADCHGMSLPNPILLHGGRASPPLDRLTTEALGQQRPRR